MRPRMRALEHYPQPVGEEGDRVAVRVACAATCRETGEEIDTELAHFWIIRDGRMARLVEYFDTARVGRALTPR